MVILATIKLKLKKQESDDGIFKIPGGLIIPIIGIASIVWLLTSLSKWEIIATIVFIAVICIIYFTMKWIKRRAKSFES